MANSNNPNNPAPAAPAAAPAPAAPAAAPAGTPAGTPPVEPQHKPVTPPPHQPQGTQQPEGTPPKQPEGTTEGKAGGTIPESGMDRVANLVEQAGLDVADVVDIMNANGGDIDADILMKLREKYGDSVATLLRDQMKDMYTKQVEATKAKDQAVYDQVQEAFKDVTEQSGEETWKELAGWAKENIDNPTRKELNQLLSQGGLAAKLAVQELTVAFKESHNQTQNAELMTGDGFSNEAAGAIDKTTYDMKLRELLDKGHDYNTSTEIKKLQNRRMRSISRGH